MIGKLFALGIVALLLSGGVICLTIGVDVIPPEDKGGQEDAGDTIELGKKTTFLGSRDGKDWYLTSCNHSDMHETCKAIFLKGGEIQEFESVGSNYNFYIYWSKEVSH